MSPSGPDEEGHAGLAALTTVARQSRAAGGDGEARARDFARGVLSGAGFDVNVEPFEYSAFPGRYGTPIGGALGATTVLGAAVLGLRGGTPWLAPATLGAGLVILALFVRAMLGDAVLDLPWMRRTSHNLVATRGSAAPSVWLVAHLDTKSQPVPSAARVAGVALLALAVLVAIVSALLQLAGVPHRMAWWAAAGLAVLGAPAVIASVVGDNSDGAVDNASGVAAVLLAATRVPHAVSFGVLLPSAEELGLAGARAWARTWGARRAPGVALNCDGVDDHGALTIMYSGTRPESLLAVLRSAGSPAPRVRRMPLGLLTDSVALADRGWRTVTVSRGSLKTLRRIHTPADSLASLRGSGIDAAATLLARAVEALAE